MLGNFTAIYKIVGISELPSINFSLLNIGKQGPKITLTKDLDQFCRDIDISRALMMSSWSGFGRFEEIQQKKLFEERLEEAKNLREKQFKKGIFLIFEGQSSVQFKPKRKLGKIGDYYFCINSFEKGVFKGKYSPNVRKILITLILSLAEGKALSLQEVGKVIYLTDRDKKKIYPFTIEVSSVSLLVSGKFDQQSKKEFQEIWGKLKRKEKYNNIISLLFRSVAEQENKLLSFIHGWTALEFFINTTFKEKYGKEWISLLSVGGPKTAPIFFERIKNVMKDKYRAGDKFLAIATILNPKNAAGDFEIFMEVKKFRDNLFHGEKYKESEYPISQTHVLLKTYLKLHLES